MDRGHLIFLIPNTAFGGLEMQMVMRSEDAVKLGYKTLYITKQGYKGEEFAKNKGLEIDFLDLKIRYFDPKSIIHLGKLMRSNKTKVCVVGKTDYLSIAIFARNLFSRKTAIAFYQQLESAFPKKDLYHNYIYNNLDSAVTLTQVMKDDFPKYTNMKTNKIEVIPYGIDLEKFSPQKHNKLDCRKIFNLPEDAFLMGLPGRITETKGQHDAITALSKAKLPNAKLVICGDKVGGSVYQRLIELAKNLNVAKDVIFIPFTFDIPDFMNAMDISLLPSKREAFGLVVVEAMASGLPVIGTRAGGVPEIIQHYENGFLYEPFNTDQLAEYMTLLYHDINIRNKTGKKALLDANERYNYQTQTDKFFNHIEFVYKKRNKLN